MFFELNWKNFEALLLRSNWDRFWIGQKIISNQNVELGRREFAEESYINFEAIMLIRGFYKFWKCIWKISSHVGCIAANTSFRNVLEEVPSKNV